MEVMWIRFHTGRMYPYIYQTVSHLQTYLSLYIILFSPGLAPRQFCWCSLHLVKRHHQSTIFLCIFL